MNAFLLALGFCLIYASWQFDPSEINGDWRTMYIAASNVERTKKDSYLTLRLRNLQCVEECKGLNITFYIRDKGRCKKYVLQTQKNKEGAYQADYAGASSFEIKYLSNGVLGLYNQNFNGFHMHTRETLVATKRDSLSTKELEEFEELTEKMKIPKENIRNVKNIDDCPAK